MVIVEPGPTDLLESRRTDARSLGRIGRRARHCSCQALLLLGPPGPQPVPGLRPGQVAAAAGVNLETLRYYERRGLLERPERTLGVHRVYPSEAVTLLRIIKTAQRLGFSLTEVGDLLDVATHRHGQRRSWPR